MKATIGRIVHYVDGSGECIAAIVTRIPAENATFIDVTIFPPAAYATAHVTAGQDEKTKRPHTWHWPERVGE